jgi:hypothetical protein
VREYDRSATDPVMVRYLLRIAEKSVALTEAGDSGQVGLRAHFTQLRHL